ncbi:MAG: hypothetical protein AAB360_01680 [Patescibacteria group bacterium]
MRGTRAIWLSVLVLTALVVPVSIMPVQARFLGTTELVVESEEVSKLIAREKVTAETFGIAVKLSASRSAVGDGADVLWDPGAITVIKYDPVFWPMFRYLRADLTIVNSRGDVVDTRPEVVIRGASADDKWQKIDRNRYVIETESITAGVNCDFLVRSFSVVRRERRYLLLFRFVDRGRTANVSGSGFDVIDQTASSKRYISGICPLPPGLTDPYLIDEDQADCDPRFRLWKQAWRVAVTSAMREHLSNAKFARGGFMTQEQEAQRLEALLAEGTATAGLTELPLPEGASAHPADHLPAGDLSQQIQNGFGALNVKVDGIGTRLEQVEGDIANLKTRVSRVEAGQPSSDVPNVPTGSIRLTIRIINQMNCALSVQTIEILSVMGQPVCPARSCANPNAPPIELPPGKYKWRHSIVGTGRTCSGWFELSASSPTPTLTITATGWVGR